MKTIFGTFGICTLALAGCETIPKTKSSIPAPAASSKAICATTGAEIRTDFKAARVSQCTVTGESSVTLDIRPEKETDPQGEPINNSAWYAFRVDPTTKGPLSIKIQYHNGKHRYHPKYSFDGTNWEFAPETDFDTIGENVLRLNPPTDRGAFFVSAQEIFTPKAHDNWTAKLAEGSDVTMSEIGLSKEGRSIKMLEIQTETEKEKPYVVWVGRQHPPEITGALALIPFSEEVLSDSALSREFLDKFNVLIVPMINPDGVVNGNWRFNMGGMDLNRDWGPFSQPETRAVKKAFERFERGDDKIAFFLDFHSTWRNLLYTQADDEPTSPPMFARDWLKAVDDRLDDEIYPFKREARHNSGKPISKNYMYDTYGISAITYEVGDATPRGAIDLSARVFAQEMMKLLLEHESKK